MNDKENKNPNDLNKADTKQKKKDNGKNEKKTLNSQEKSSSNIKRIMIIFFILLIGLISYIAYFGVIKDPTIYNKTNNTAKLATEHKVVRGNIYDTFGQVLAQTNVNGAEQSIYYTFGRST